MKPILKQRAEQLKVKQALELLNKEVKVKYPPGSFILFTAIYHKYKGEKPATVSCGWCDKVGGERPLKNIIDSPPEWQNISYNEAAEIAAMFDDNFFIHIAYNTGKIL